MRTCGHRTVTIAATSMASTNFHHHHDYYYYYYYYYYQPFLSRFLWVRSATRQMMLQMAEKDVKTCCCSSMTGCMMRNSSL